MTDTESWLVEHFRANAELGDRDPAELLDDDFLELALIDSFGLVVLLAAIEEELGVRLEADELRDQRFRTIRGLAALVEETRVR